MSIKRTSHLLSKASLGVSGLLGLLVACGDNMSGSESGVSVSDATSKANVALIAYDASGKVMASCAGTLIGPTTVLTAGHCVAGATKWAVNAPALHSGTVTGFRGVSYDWANFQSNKSHNLHVDIAIVILEKSIALDHYPTLASSPYDGTTAVQRMRRSDVKTLNATFQAVQGDVQLGTSKGFAYDYLGAFGAGEVLDTGGALVDPQTNVVYGVVSGKGETTGLLHMARVDVMGHWLQTKLVCHNNHPNSFSTACHPGNKPDGGTTCGNDGGGPTTSSSSSSGGSSSGSSGTHGGSSSSGGSSGSSSSGSSGSGGGGDCEGGGDGSGGSSSSSGGSSSGFGGSSSGSSSGFGGSSGNGTGGTVPPSGSSGSSGNGTTSGSSGTGTGGTAPPNGSSGSSGNGTIGSSGGSTGTGGLVPPQGGGTGVCWGSCPQNVINNVPPESTGTGGIMPPSGQGGPQNQPSVSGDGPGCFGPTCGGCAVGCGDDTIDYGGDGAQGTGGYTQPPVR